MNIAWLTDIHLNFLKVEARKKFYQHVIETDVDRILITGDIAEAKDVCEILTEFSTCMNKPRIKSNTPRKIAMYIARKYGDYRFQELADAFGLQHYGSASYAVYAFAQELQNNEGLKTLLPGWLINWGQL